MHRGIAHRAEEVGVGANFQQGGHGTFIAFFDCPVQQGQFFVDGVRVCPLLDEFAAARAVARFGGSKQRLILRGCFGLGGGIHGTGEDGSNVRRRRKRGADGFVICRCGKRGGKEGEDERGSFHGFP